MSEYPLMIVDGIIALAAPGEVKAATEDGSFVHILVHSLLTADPSLGSDERATFAASECGALRAASCSSVASRWSAQDVLARCPGPRSMWCGRARHQHRRPTAAIPRSCWSWPPSPRARIRPTR